MEEKGYIEIKVKNIDGSLKPKDVDISEIQEMMDDLETFLYPSRKEKRNRPHISYDLEEGSAVHKFSVAISSVLLFNGLISEIKDRNNIDFLDYRRQSIIDKFQRIAEEEAYVFELKTSLRKGELLIIDSNTNFEQISPNFYETEFYLYGEIYQEGGKTPNLHITTKKFGNLTVSATKKQIMDGEKKTYRPYGIKVKGKKSLDDGKPIDLELIEFIHYKPFFDKSLLDKVIEKASKNLERIKDVDSWLQEFKVDTV